MSGLDCWGGCLFVLVGTADDFVCKLKKFQMVYDSMIQFVKDGSTCYAPEGLLEGGGDGSDLLAGVLLQALFHHLCNLL